MSMRWLQTTREESEKLKTQRGAMGEERGHVGRWRLGQAWERHAGGTGEGSAEEGSPS